jgi:hypothetical protein
MWKVWIYEVAKRTESSTFWWIWNHFAFRNTCNFFFSNLLIIKNSSQQLNVIFSPTSATHHKFNLHCHTLRKKYVIPCKGTGVDNTLRCSHSTNLATQR